MPGPSNFNRIVSTLLAGDFFRWSWHLRNYLYCVMKTRFLRVLSTIVCYKHQHSVTRLRFMNCFISDNIIKQSVSTTCIDLKFTDQKILFMKSCLLESNWSDYLFFYLGFLSRTFKMIHRTAREGRWVEVCVCVGGAGRGGGGVEEVGWGWVRGGLSIFLFNSSLPPPLASQALRQ